MTTPTQGEHAQPEAIRLAEWLESSASNADMGRKPQTSDHRRRAAAELRRLHAQVAAQPAVPEGGPPGSGGWEKHALEMERQRDYYRQRCDTMHEHQSGDVWYWQGDGNDHPESMVNSLPVVIRADQLRALMPQCRGNVERHSDQSVLVSFGSCREASVFEQAMLGAAVQPDAAHYGPLRDADAEYGKRLQVYASTAGQTAAPQGGANAELPEPIADTYWDGPEPAKRYGNQDMREHGNKQFNAGREFEAVRLAGLRASHGQAPAGARSADELARDLKNAIDTSLELRQQLRLMEEHVRGEVWRWQPEGSNELATMGNRMGVLIYASDLRNLISAAPTAQPAPAAQQPAPSAAAAEIAELLECSGCLKVGQKDRALAGRARLLPAQHGGVL